MRKGFFITFEGLEGSGKSVQVGFLESKLREMDFSIVSTREPGGTRIGEQMRAITHNPENVDLTPIAEAYLMAASRAQHVAETIKPALLSGNIVISDRYIDSSVAYQGYGRKLGSEKILALNAFAVNGIMPDITIFVDVPYDIGLARRNGSSKVDRMDLQQKDFYLRVQQGYETIIYNNPKRFLRIDGKKTINEVARTLWQQLQPHLPRP